MLQPIRQGAEQKRLDFREDVFHFRAGTVPVAVEVTPERRKTPLGDLVLRGFIDGKEIEVVFPGRRQAAAIPLLQRLMAKVKMRELDPASRAGGEVRQTLKIDGAWRIRLMNEQDAKPERRFQLVAARWRYRGSDGVEHVFGHLPTS